MKSLKKKAQAVLYIYFILAAVILIAIAAVFAPMGVLFNTKMYTAGEDILQKSLDEINNIQDDEVRASVTATVNAALDAGENNIEVNAGIFQYSWVIILIVTGVIFFLNSRRLIETGQGYI